MRAEEARGEPLERQRERERAGRSGGRPPGRDPSAAASRPPPPSPRAARGARIRRPSVAEARVELATAEAKRAAGTRSWPSCAARRRRCASACSAVTENVHGLELQIYEKRLHVAGLLERAASELGLDRGCARRRVRPGQSSPRPRTRAAPPRPFDRAEQQRRLAEAERKLAQLGRVNPLALEEFAALEQRHMFLTEQLADLTQTRKDLLTIIEEIDEKMQTIFRGAFEDTQDGVRARCSRCCSPAAPAASR